MKPRWILHVVCGSAVFLLLGSCSPTKYTAKANEELYGTWVNTSYSGKAQPGAYLPQKEVIGSTGYAIYRLADDFAKYFTGSEQIVSKWTDSEGNIWYKTYRASTNGQSSEAIHLLYKLSKSATVLESAFVVRAKYAAGSFPTKIDPTDLTYRTYTRAEK